MYNTNEKENNEKGFEPLSSNYYLKSDGVVNEIAYADISTTKKRRDIIKRIENYGTATLGVSEERSNSIGQMILQISSNTSIHEEIKDDLIKLQEEMRKINPNAVDFSKTNFGLDKYFSPVTRYFKKVEQENTIIEDIVSSLNEKRNKLSDNNVTLEIEMDRINDTIQMIQLEYEVGMRIKEKIQSIINEAKENGKNEEQTSFYEMEVIIPLELRLDSLFEALDTNDRLYQAISEIRAKNIKIIDNVDRAKEATLSAINMAAIVGNSLYNQKIIFNNAMSHGVANSDLLGYMSGNVEEDAKVISKQIFKNDITTDGLKASFENAYRTFSTDNEAEKGITLEGKNIKF